MAREELFHEKRKICSTRLTPWSDPETGDWSFLLVGFCLTFGSFSHDPRSGLAGVLFAIVLVEVSRKSMYRVFAGFLPSDKTPIARGAHSS